MFTINTIDRFDDEPVIQIVIILCQGEYVDKIESFFVSDS